MAIASGLFWIVIGVAYIIYQGFKADWATTVVVLLVGVAIPVAGVAIYFVDKLLQLIHPLFAGAFWCSAIIVGYILYLRWCKRSKEKEEAKLQEMLQRCAEETAKRDRMFETGEYTEEFVEEQVKKFSTPMNLRFLEIELRRRPTPDDIREAAIKSAKEQRQRNKEWAAREAMKKEAMKKEAGQEG